MKRFGPIFVVIAGLLLPLLALAQSPVRVTATIVLRDQEEQAPLKDASQVAVWLVPIDRPTESVTPSSLRPTSYQMLQHDKRFEPHLLVIPVGSTVVFPNLDPWFHNVFSLYRGKRFDLGLYQAGSQKSVRFDRIGPSYIFCNIHPEMSAVILAVDSHLIGISETSGNLSIPDVPPGRYRVHFWYEFAPSPNQIPSREVTVTEADPNLGKFTIIAKPRRDEKHLNKYGQEYDPQSLGTDY